MTSAVPGLARSSAAGKNRAIVCIFLAGGHDSANMIAPLNTAEYARYRSARGRLAIARSELIPVTAPDAGEYGFHPALRSVTNQFAQGRAAVIANTGDAEPPAGYQTPALDYLPDGYMVPKWMTDVAGKTHAYRFSSGLSALLPDWKANAEGLVDAPLLMEVAEPQAASFEAQFSQIAKLVARARQMQLGRQLYVATLGGFQRPGKHDELMGRLDAALGSFTCEAKEREFSDRVVLYTDTEFGRALHPHENGHPGIGWGAHQLVLGAAVQGGVIYGSLLGVEGGQRHLVPEISRDQMVGPVARWAGFAAGTLGGATHEALNSLV